MSNIGYKLLIGVMSDFNIFTKLMLFLSILPYYRIFIDIDIQLLHLIVEIYHGKGNVKINAVAECIEQCSCRVKWYRLYCQHTSRG